MLHTISKLQKNWADVILVLCLVLAFSFTMLEAHTQCLINTSPCSSSSGGYDPFGCNVSSGNPAQAASDYIMQYCPSAELSSTVFETTGDFCERVTCTPDVFTLMICDLCNTYGCGELCRNYAYAVPWCSRCELLSNDHCDSLKSQVCAFDFAYDVCQDLAGGYPTDPYCVESRKLLETACSNFAMSCPADSQVTSWCTLCTCVMMMPPGSLFCDDEPEADPPPTKIYLCTGKEAKDANGNPTGSCKLELIEDCTMINGQNTPGGRCVIENNCPVCRVPQLI